MLGGGAGWDLIDSVDNNHTVRPCVSAKILYGSYSFHFQPPWHPMLGVSRGGVSAVSAVGSNLPLTFTSGAVGWRTVVCMVLFEVSTVECVERGQFLEGEA